MGFGLAKRAPSSGGGRPAQANRPRNGTRPIENVGATLALAQSSGRYRVATILPDNWLPIGPVRIDVSESDVRLRRSHVLLDRDV